MEQVKDDSQQHPPSLEEQVKNHQVQRPPLRYCKTNDVKSEPLMRARVVRIIHSSMTAHVHLEGEVRLKHGPLGTCVTIRSSQIGDQSAKPACGG